MKVFTHEVLPFETDMYGLLKPSQLLRYAMHASALHLHADRLDEAVDRSGLNTSWMLARIKNDQYLQVHAGEKLEVHCSQRAIQGAAYVRQIQICREGELVSECLQMWMLIDMDKRRILRVTELEKFRGLMPEPICLPEISRLTQHKDLPEKANVSVLRSLCDTNGHLSSANYLDVLCDVFDFWKDGSKLMRSVQIDFHSEFLPEETVVISGRSEGTETLARGAHVSGASGFTAVFTAE